MNEYIKGKIYSIIMKTEPLLNEEKDVLDNLISIHFHYTSLNYAPLTEKEKNEASIISQLINYIFSRNEESPTPATIYAVDKINHTYEENLEKDSIKRKTRNMQNAKNSFESNGYIQTGFVLILTILLGFILGVILWNIK